VTAAPPPAHWSAAWIGTPWRAGETDCWNFARRIWAQQFGWHVPAVPVDPCDSRAGMRALAAPDAALWRNALRLSPQEGDALLMACARQACHVGVLVLPGGAAAVLHALEQPGAILTALSRLDLLGYRIVGRWRWRAA
jgi:cell wall-associated NlpC family hydrolase